MKKLKKFQVQKWTLRTQCNRILQSEAHHRLKRLPFCTQKGSVLDMEENKVKKSAISKMAKWEFPVPILSQKHYLNNHQYKQKNNNTFARAKETRREITAPRWSTKLRNDALKTVGRVTSSSKLGNTLQRENLLVWEREVNAQLCQWTQW